MRLNPTLAEEIDARAHLILDRDIILTNTQGLVLNGESRGKVVAEAVKACEENVHTQAPLDGNIVEWFPFLYEGMSLGAFGVTADTGKISADMISLIQGLAEVLVHQHFLLDKVQSTESVKASFIKEFLQSASIDPAGIHRQADILQMNLRANQAVILLQLAGLESNLHAQVSNLSAEEQRLQLSKVTEDIIGLIRDAFKNNPENVIAYLGSDTFVLLKGIGGDNLNSLNTQRFLLEKAKYLFDMLQKSQQNVRVTVGVGQFYPDLGGIRKSYQEAKLALSVGTKVWGAGKVYHIRQVGMFTALTNIPHDRKAELAHQILHPLLRDQQLYKTVRTFLASGLNLTDAAQKLHVHRNTLIYRLDKTKKLINLDPRVFDDALQIKLGLMFYQA